MDAELLRQMARHQVWADAEHWRTLRGTPALLEDGEIRERLKHMLAASERLQRAARGEPVEAGKITESGSAEELEAAITHANSALVELLASVDLEKAIALPRGPKGPFSAPVSAILLQVVSHGEHHRAQNALRMRALGVQPPMTDFIYWYAVGQP